MINSSYFELLEKFSNLPIDVKQYFAGIADQIKRKNSEKENKVNLSDDMINTIWNETVDRISLLFPFISRDVYEDFKSEVIVSIYASLVYAMSEPVTKEDVINEFIKKDPASKGNASTKESVKASINSFINLMRQGADVNFLGQYKDVRALQYLTSVLISDKNFRAYNLLDYYFYIKGYNYWPFTQDNEDGMLLENMFKFYQTVFQENINFEKSGNYFSAYIFEELFCPIRISKFISIFLEIFKDEFKDYQKPEREKALRLMVPFFHMPLIIQERYSVKYCNSLKKYLYNVDLSNMKCRLSFLHELNSVLFLTYVVFPILQSAFAMALYSITECNLEQMKDALDLNITENSDKIDYFIKLKSSLNEIDELLYPSNGTIKVAGNNNLKRNNKSIKSFEINLTHSFYNQRRFYDIIENVSILKQPWSIDTYMQGIQNTVLYLENTPSSEQTINYLRYIRNENNDHGWMR